MVAEAEVLKKFDLVKGPGIRLGVIVSEPFTAHFFDSAIASQKAFVPFDLTDPKSYEIEVNDMVLVCVLVPEFEQAGTNAVRLCSLSPAEFDSYNAYTLYDYATDNIRGLLSVEKYAKKLWGERV